MKLLKILVCVLFLITCLGLLFVLFGDRTQQLENRNTLRQQDLTDYMLLIESSVEASLSGSIAPILIPELPMQIGTAETGCQLQTKHCTVLLDNCISPGALIATVSGTLSADVLSGTTERTMYAVWLESPATIVLAACDNEIVDPIVMKKSFETVTK